MQYAQAKRNLLRTLRHDVDDERVLSAIEEVTREAFVPAHLVARAYDNTPLPIGEGQTISQPTIVGIMLQALDVQPTDVVLDVGCGSGYQAAVLSHLAAHVVGVERIPALAERARQALAAMGCSNVEVVGAGAALGCPGRRFDGIVVGAAAPAVPRSLIEQLEIGGRLVIPVGTPVEQQLARVVREEGGVQVQWLGPCRFVPLIGEEGWSED